MSIIKEDSNEFEKQYHINEKELQEIISNKIKFAIRKLIIELGCKGVLSASDRDTAIIDQICKREGITL